MIGKASEFYIDNNGRFEYDPEFPFVVVGVQSDVEGKFPNRVVAEMFLEYALEFWGRIIDTRPEEGTE